MGAGVPLLNEYKQEFVWKRIPQTIFGGPKLKLGYDAPAYVYLSQVFFWVLPWLLGGVFTLVLELAYTDSEIHDYLLLYCCLYGACITIFVVVVQTISTVVQIKEKENTKAIAKKNIMAEEDEVDFQTCCGAETIEFVIPPKYFKINILVHGLISGAMCGLTLWYLLPWSLNSLYGNNYGVTAVLFILGWLTLSIAQYSLTATAPPEPAIFRTMDVYELFPMTRPFYVLVCLSFHIVYWNYSSFETINQVLHIVFACLPLIWLLGLLPPVDALLVWLLEQIHVFIFGGSPMASNCRLIIMMILSVAEFLGAFFIPTCFGTVVLSASLGYLLSTDLGSLGVQMMRTCVTKNRVSTSQFLRDSKILKHNSGFLWTWCLWTVLYHVAILALVTGEAAVLNYYSFGLKGNICGWVIVGLCVSEKITRDMQGVYIGFGIIRNYFFPHSSRSIQLYKDGKRRLIALNFFRRLIFNWAAPLTMVAYLSIEVTQKNVMTEAATLNLNTTNAVWYTFGIVRAFRWAWQGTAHSLVEMSVIHILLSTLLSGSVIRTLHMPLLLLIAGLIRDRLYQLINKLFFFFSLLITSWRDKKQRRGSSALVLLMSFMFFPVVLAIMVVAALLSAPLLPLFTLPVFFVAFPRPQKFWPEAVGASANVCADTVYYRQFAPMFARALRTGFSSGSLGEPQVGNHYLVRFQDRLLWVMVLERGAAYCNVSIKGLELQETSCHTTEAARLDDIFEASFESENGFSLCSVNEYPLHCLTPVDGLSIQTYSDARNVLTGVIDSPESVEMTLRFFVRSLVWLVLHHVNKVKIKAEQDKKKKDQQSKASGEKVRKGFVLAANGGVRPKSKIEINHNLHTSNFNTKGSLNNNAPVVGPPSLPPLPSSLTSLPPLNGTGGTRNAFGLPCLQEGQPAEKSRKSSWSSSINSFSDGLWSDDDLEKPKSKKKLKNVKPSKIGNAHSQPVNPTSTPVVPVYYPRTSEKEKPDQEDLLDDMEFGLPAMDISQNKPVSPSHRAAFFANPLHSSSRVNGNHIYKPVTNLASSPDFKCQYSSHMSLPNRWRELPIEHSQLVRHMASFPADWYRYVLAQLDWSATGQPGEKVALDVGADDALTNCYSQLIMACFSAFDTPDKLSGPSYLYKSYIGDVPWNAMMDWLSEDKELYGLVIRAFRYGFKLMLDSMLLGDISEHEDLEKSLLELDTQWYIGRESDPEWKAAVLDNRTSLFSIGRNPTQTTFTSRILSLQEVMVHVGRLNTEVVRGQWANLSLELLYMTNDDEERYSIQAHPAILRNLTVQAADPPLGYPIFSSQPISVPTL